MPNNINNINWRKKFTRQTIISNTFYQMPRFLTAGEFAGNKMSNNARVLYTLLLDRHRLSVKSGWFDENGEVYVYFKREEMQTQLGLSERTVVKVMQELRDFSLVEEKQQGLSKPNKIYVLSPVISDDENPTPYLDPDTDYNPDKDHSESYDESFNEDCDTGYGITPPPVSEELRFQTLKNFDSLSEKNAVSGSVNFVSADPQNLSPINNKLINNKKSNNYMSNTEVSKTTATVSSADAEPPATTEAAEGKNLNCTSQAIPYSQILETYNRLCETKWLRPIHSINGTRKSITAARVKEYGLGGFVDLFEKVSASIFLCGGGERGWKADYDWLIDSTNMQKVLEGKYDNDHSNVPQQQLYETYSTSRFSNPPHNKQERHDPFLEKAMTAYAIAAQAI